MRLYRERKVEPKESVRKSCLPLLIRLPLLAAIELPMLWSPLHQGLPDKLAATVTIRDR
jgi:hypothetical protein